MKKKYTLFKKVLLAFVFALSGGNIWAETQIGRITIARNSFQTVEKYGVDDQWSVVALTGETVTGYADLATTSQTMTMTASGTYASHPYNIDVLPGAITKITLVGSGDGSADLRQWIPYLATTPLNKDKYHVGSTKLEEKSFVSISTVPVTWDIDASMGYRYFYLLLKGGTTSLGKIEIEYEIPEPVVISAPVFSLPEGTYYDPQSVTLSCDTEGTTLYYTLDGTEPTSASTPYTGAIAIDRTTTLKAIAYKDGHAGSVSAVTYTFPVEVSTIAAFLEANTEGIDETVYKITGSLVVTYQNGNNLYVQDETAALLIDGGQIEETYTNGQVLTGVTGIYKELDGMVKLIPGRSLPAATDGTAVEPAVMAIGQITGEHQSRYVRLEKVRFSEDVTHVQGTAGTSCDFTDGVNTIAYDNKTFCLLDGAYSSNKEYNITAIVGVHNATVRLLPVSVGEIVPEKPILYISGIENDVIDFGQVERGTRKELTFVLEGKNLVGDVLLTVDNTAFALSETLLSPDKDGILTETTFALVYAPTVNNTDLAQLIVTSANMVEDIVISVSGICVDPALLIPEAEEATDITATGFTARWQAVEHATSYELYVWKGVGDITGNTIVDKELIAGSPFTVEDNSYPVTDLTANTLYSYSVVAKAEGYADSPASATVKVTTAPQGPVTGMCQNALFESIRFDGRVIFNPANLQLTIYNMVGVPVISGTEDIDMRAFPAGIYLLKTGNGVMKMIK